MATSTLRVGIVGLLLVSSATADAATLRWKFRSGETLHWVMDQSTTTSVVGGDQKIKSMTTQTIDLDWVVKDVGTDGVATLTQRVTRLRTRIESPLGVFEYDSRDPNPPKSPLGASAVPLLKALVGAEFAFKMKPQGAISDVQVPDAVVRAIREAGAMAGMASMFTADGMKNMITESALIVPQEDLTKGKSWSAQAKLPLPQIGSLLLDKTYAYQGPETHDDQPMERIDLEIEARVERSSDSKINVELKSQGGKGKFYFDNAAGRVADSTVTERIEMLFKLPGAEVTQLNETTTTMKLVKGASKP